MLWVCFTIKKKGKSSMSLPERSFVNRSAADRRSTVIRRKSLGALFSSQDILEDKRELKDRRHGWEDRKSWERNSEWSSVPSDKHYP